MTFQEAALMVIKSFADEDEQGFLIAADALNELGMEPTADRRPTPPRQLECRGLRVGYQHGVPEGDG